MTILHIYKIDLKREGYSLTLINWPMSLSIVNAEHLTIINVNYLRCKNMMDSQIICMPNNLKFDIKFSHELTVLVDIIDLV